MQKIAIIVGTRPEAIKMVPVYLKFKEDPNFDVLLVSTGQHKEMVEQIFQFFGIRPEVEINVMTENQSLASLSIALFQEGEKFIKRSSIDYLFVQGDTTSAMIFGLLAFYNRVKVAHVEAGLRTYNNYSPFPEEVNRKIISSFANIHFCPTENAVLALQKENTTTNVFNVGNTVVDSLKAAVGIINEDLKKYEIFFSGKFDITKRMILITSHRRENFGDGLENIIKAILSLSERYPEYQFVYPVHLNPNVQEPVNRLLAGKNNIILMDPLPYDQLVYLMMHSHIILTDSGGLQEEAPELNKPVIILRDTTERPEVIEAGCGILAGIKMKDICDIFIRINDNEEVYNNMINKSNPFGDGNAAAYIKKIFTEKSALSK